MNEEQNEQNIPAPVLLENNDQNITPIKKWQIKSWQIALLGIIAQILNGLLIFPLNSNTHLFDVIVIYPIGFLFMSLVYDTPIVIVLVLYILCVVLLYSDKDRREGAIFSIISGVISIAFVIANVSALNSNVGIIGFFLFLAGIYYFWKKV